MRAYRVLGRAAVMPQTITLEYDGDKPEWAEDGTDVVFVPANEYKRIVARSQRNFQLYLDARADAVRERWRVEDEVAR